MDRGSLQPSSDKVPTAHSVQPSRVFKDVWHEAWAGSFLHSAINYILPLACGAGAAELLLLGTGWLAVVAEGIIGFAVGSVLLLGFYLVRGPITKERKINRSLRNEIQRLHVRIEELTPRLDLNVIADTVYVRPLAPGEAPWPGKMLGYELVALNALITNRNSDKSVNLVAQPVLWYEFGQDTRLSSQVKDGFVLADRDISYMTTAEVISIEPGKIASINLRYLEPEVNVYDKGEPLRCAHFSLYLYDTVSGQAVVKELPTEPLSFKLKKD